MGLRVNIQTLFIETFKVEQFDIVTYNSEGIPSVTGSKEEPVVECNEVSNIVEATIGQGSGYIFKSWTFEVICSFKNEIDYSDFVLGLGNLTFTYNDAILVEISMDGSIAVKHPPRNLSHNGSEIKFIFNVNLKK